MAQYLETNINLFIHPILVALSSLVVAVTAMTSFSKSSTFVNWLAILAISSQAEQNNINEKVHAYVLKNQNVQSGRPQL